MEKLKEVKKGEIIAEGKTKIISRKKPGIVIITNKDILSKGDGKELLTLPGKGRWATETTCNVFESLKRKNIQVAYHKRVDGISFCAPEADMVKLEIVVRNIPYGSYLLRHPEVQEGTVFDEPVIEIFFKSDKDHDPLAVFDNKTGQWRLYHAKKPMEEGFIREMPLLATTGNIVIGAKIVAQIMEIARQVNSALKEAWEKQKVALVDFKIEFGFIIKDGKVTLALADVIDNDSWRIWPLGDKYLMKDKEFYRMLKEVTPEDRNKLKENYQWVAEATKRFLS